MLIPVVVVIGAMWLPVALLFLGKGEAKGTGFITGVVGALVLVGSMVHVAVFKDPVIPTLLFMHGTFYLSVSWALFTGQEDLRSVGNVALATAIVSTIFTILFITGSPVLEDGKQLIAPSGYLAREVNGTNPGREYVRMALVATLEECVEAAHRIKQFCS